MGPPLWGGISPILTNPLELWVSGSDNLVLGRVGHGDHPVQKSDRPGFRVKDLGYRACMEGSGLYMVGSRLYRAGFSHEPRLLDHPMYDSCRHDSAARGKPPRTPLCKLYPLERGYHSLWGLTLGACCGQLRLPMTNPKSWEGPPMGGQH